MSDKPMGTLEAIGLVQAFGDLYLTKDEVAWVMERADQRGCRYKRNELKPEDATRIIEIGKRIKKIRKIK